MVPPVADERAGLLAFLAQQRSAAVISAYGLTDEQARSSPTASTLTLGGLIKHLAFAERTWMDRVLERHREDGRNYAAGFRLEVSETLAGAIADYEAASAETDAILATVDDLDQAVPVPKGVPWFPADLEAWSVRWVILHLIEETARHAGHADIIRETIDGATSHPLMAAAEDWPATPWMAPWAPPEG
jgi:uncharacterized damage-inducible protein DinB